MTSAFAGAKIVNIDNIDSINGNYKLNVGFGDVILTDTNSDSSSTVDDISSDNDGKKSSGLNFLEGNFW